MQSKIDENLYGYFYKFRKVSFFNTRNFSIAMKLDCVLQLVLTFKRRKISKILIKWGV